MSDTTDNIEPTVSPENSEATPQPVAPNPDAPTPTPEAPAPKTIPTRDRLRHSSGMQINKPVEPENPSSEPKAPEGDPANPSEEPAGTIQPNEPTSEAEDTGEQQQQQIDDAGKTHFNFEEYFGENFKDAESLKTHINQLQTRDKELADQQQVMQKALEEKQNPFANPIIEMANTISAENPDTTPYQALELAKRIASVDQDTKIIDLLVQQEIIQDPMLAPDENELREQISDEYEASEGIAKRRIESKAEKARLEIQKLQTQYLPKKSENVNPIETHTQLVNDANNVRGEFLDQLNEIEIQGVKVPISDPSQLANFAIDQLINMGSVTPENKANALQVAQQIAILDAIKSPEFSTTYENQLRDKLKAEILKERVNPSVIQQTTQAPKQEISDEEKAHKAAIERHFGNRI